MKLSANDLRSKFGFEDGDLLSNNDLREPTVPQPPTGYKWKHQVLIELVRKHLHPLMPLAELEELNTIHNPIRVVGWYDLELLENPVSVEITNEQVEAAALAVEERWRNHENPRL